MVQEGLAVKVVSGVRLWQYLSFREPYLFELRIPLTLEGSILSQTAFFLGLEGVLGD